MSTLIRSEDSVSTAMGTVEAAIIADESAGAGLLGDRATLGEPTGSGTFSASPGAGIGSAGACGAAGCCTAPTAPLDTRGDGLRMTSQTMIAGIAAEMIQSAPSTGADANFLTCPDEPPIALASSDADWASAPSCATAAVGGVEVAATGRSEVPAASALGLFAASIAPRLDSASMSMLLAFARAVGVQGCVSRTPRVPTGDRGAVLGLLGVLDDRDRGTVEGGGALTRKGGFELRFSGDWLIRAAAIPSAGVGAPCGGKSDWPRETPDPCVIGREGTLLGRAGTSLNPKGLLDPRIRFDGGGPADGVVVSSVASGVRAWTLGATLFTGAATGCEGADALLASAGAAKTGPRLVSSSSSESPQSESISSVGGIDDKSCARDSSALETIDVASEAVFTEGWSVVEVK